MAKKKKRSTRSKRTNRSKQKPVARHSLPEGFWPQVSALTLVILALLLVLGMLSSGGPLPESTWNLGRYLLGWAAFILPVLFVFRAVQVFRAENNRVPKSVSLATVVFAVLAGGFIQLMSVMPADLALAESGEGGGIIGWLVAKAALTLVSAGVGALIALIALIVTSLFVLSVTPDKLLASIISLFKRDISDSDAAYAAVAAKVKDEGLKNSEFKLNEGVPTTMSSDEPKSASRLSSLRDSVKPDKLAEDQAALISSGDIDWQVPSLDLLEKTQSPADPGDVKHNAQIIKDTLDEFNIDAQMEGANVGPKVTQYTLKPPSGVKLTRITALETNIALNLAAQALRIEAPIPGQRAVGIEVPNRKAADVRLYGILKSKQWQSAREPLAFAIGKDIAGEAVIGELNKMPHIMIAGQTGSGKSVMINTLLCSLLYRNSPADMRLILVDPKQVEMAPYQDIPHLLTPVITEPEKCISALKWAVNEMERRYSLLAEEKLRDISSYNRKKKEEAMPYVVIVIDELSDLMIVAARDVEGLIVRLAQKARAVGIHLVLATQRPSVNVITGLIKANVPARIAFTVASQVESRIILDQMGAEKLLGLGDMLMTTPQMSKPRRIQGAWVTDEEVVKITDFLRMQRPPQYDDEIVAQPVQLNGKGGVVMDMAGTEDSEYKDAVRVVLDGGKASTSYLQRRLRIGYSKASRIMDMMEEQGIIGPADGSRPRDVLISSMDDLYDSSEA